MPRNDLIQVRSDTSSNWTSVNPTLATGEIGFESNTGKFKIGTGSTVWSSLPYTSDTAGSATTAGSWTTARTITLAGDLTGSVSINGSANVSLSATIAANSVALGTDTTGNYMSGITGTSPVTVSHTAGEGSSASVSLAANYGDTLNPYASKTANYVLAAPNGVAGVPTFRAIVKSDIPTLDQDTSGSAASVPASGITGQTGMWTSANRPGPHRLYRNDGDSDYNLQTYYTGSKWRLQGYNGVVVHNDVQVGQADTWTTTRTISLTNDITGSDSINGSGDISISATIGNGKITNAMIAANAVTASKIASGAVTNSEVSGTAAIALSKLATTGTLQADYLIGNGTYVSGLNASALTLGTVPAARISSAINYSVNRLYTNDSIPIIANDAVTSSGSGYYATWVSVSGGGTTDYYLERYTSTRKDKENFQPLDNIITPNMIDDIDIQLWNRKTAPGIPEVGPIAEEMHEISPFLSACGMLINDDGTVTADEPGGINSGAWMSLLTIGIQDIRQRLAKLENPNV